MSWSSLIARVAMMVALAAGAAACDDGVDRISAVERGRELFESPAFSASEFNVFACGTCHGTSAAPPTIAVSLAGVTDRSAWWNGEIRTLYGAVDFCWAYFMRGHPDLDPQSDDARALFAYLESLGSGQPAVPLSYTVVETIADPGAGDAAAGATAWQAHCASCHGAPHTGAGRLGALVSVVPESSRTFAAELGVDPRLVVIEKVRHGRFFGVGGNMPFYPSEILSDQALADILEYLDP
ncbi:MAG: c-type cytochrome [Myxococcota bacterium]